MEIKSIKNGNEKQTVKCEIVITEVFIGTRTLSDIAVEIIYSEYCRRTEKDIKTAKNSSSA